MAGLVVLGIWAAGLLAFADRIVRLTPAAEPAAADGVVALTGGSDVRLRVGTALLEAGKGRRLLVSGVNHRVTRGEVWALTGAAKPMFDCCVDLDFTAANTIGNARETAGWARTMGYHSLILVTADYHTPRASLELKAMAPQLAVTVYPVATADLDARKWWTSSDGARRMVAEYMKYLVALGRETLLAMGPSDNHAAATPPEAHRS